MILSIFRGLIMHITHTLSLSLCLLSYSEINKVIRQKLNQLEAKRIRIRHMQKLVTNMTFNWDHFLHIPDGIFSPGSWTSLSRDFLGLFLLEIHRFGIFLELAGPDEFRVQTSSEGHGKRHPWKITPFRGILLD